jgi:hypothetical protein
MTITPETSIVAVVTFLMIAFVLGGAAPVFIVRLIARIYPKGNPRRKELPSEMVRAKGMHEVPEQWRWLGEVFALAVCEGGSARLRSLRRGTHRRELAAEARPTAYEHTNSQGVTYYLHKKTVVLRGGKRQTIYFFAKEQRGVRGDPCALPMDKEVMENPRNGVLGITTIKRKSRRIL